MDNNPLPAPPENGDRLSTVLRKPYEELRFNWCHYKEAAFLNIRLWIKKPDGAWIPTKGITLKPGELTTALDALQKALSQAQAESLVEGTNGR